MTKKLRYRIMAVIMLLSSATLASILIAINLLQMNRTTREERGISQFYLEDKARTAVPMPDSAAPEDTDNGQLPHVPPSAERKDFPRFHDPSSETDLKQMAKLYPLVYARYSENRKLISMDTSQGNSYDRDTLEKFCEEILTKKDDHGKIGDFSYTRRHSPQGYDIVLMDRKLSGRRNQTLLRYSIVIGVIGLFVFFGLSYLISGLMVRPVEVAFTAQKEFIAAASHELKTPLTVIQANSELLEDEYGTSRWLSYIQAECAQMTKLIHSLLVLTKLEQLPDTPKTMAAFNASDACLQRILPFESVAFEKQLSLSYRIAPDIYMKGDAGQLQQVLSILLDNALYHTTENGKIEITLSRKKHSIRLTVANEGAPIPPEEREALFLRFYRRDKARSREDGHFGLGLSIAKSIIEQYHGSIDIQCENGMTSFHVTLKNASLPTR